jgi:hypothetical protein
MTAKALGNEALRKAPESNSSLLFIDPSCHMAMK